MEDLYKNIKFEENNKRYIPDILNTILMNQGEDFLREFLYLVINKYPNYSQNNPNILINYVENIIIHTKFEVRYLSDSYNADDTNVLEDINKFRKAITEIWEFIKSNGIIATQIAEDILVKAKNLY